MNAASRAFVILVAGSAAFTPGSGRADDGSSPLRMLNTVLEKLQVKAKPADPAPDFVRTTRPDPSGLDYIERPVPHGVSPVPTKTPDEVAAMKAALDQAHARQLGPANPPVQIDKARKATRAKPPK